MKKFTMLTAVFVFLSFAQRIAYADSITFGPSTTSTLTVTGVTNYCTISGDCSGLGIQGYASGIDSTGNAYSLGSTYGTFFSPDPTTASDWQGTPGCAGFNFTDCRWDGDFSLSDSSISGGVPETALFQAPDGEITLTLIECVAASNNVCTQTANFIFNLQVDPIMLSNLQAGQSVTLSVIGGCVTTGTSCGSTAPTATPEPRTLGLFMTGLIVLAFFVRRRMPALRRFCE